MQTCLTVHQRLDTLVRNDQRYSHCSVQVSESRGRIFFSFLFKLKSVSIIPVRSQELCPDNTEVELVCIQVYLDKGCQISGKRIITFSQKTPQFSCYRGRSHELSRLHEAPSQRYRPPPPPHPGCIILVLPLCPLRLSSPTSSQLHFPFPFPVPSSQHLPFMILYILTLSEAAFKSS